MDDYRRPKCVPTCNIGDLDMLRLVSDIFDHTDKVGIGIRVGCKKCNGQFIIAVRASVEEDAIFQLEEDIRECRRKNTKYLTKQYKAWLKEKYPKEE